MNFDLGSLTSGHLSFLKKDPLKWPFLFQVAVAISSIVLVLVVAYIFFISENVSNLSRFKEKEVQLRAEYVRKKTTAVNLPEYKGYYESLLDNLSVLLSKLPKEYEVNALLRDVNQLGINNHMIFYSFRPQPKVVQELYVEHPVSISMAGTYNDFGHFLTDLASLNNLIVVTDLTVETPDASRTMQRDKSLLGPSQLFFSFIARVFHATHSLGGPDNSQTKGPTNTVASPSPMGG